MSQDNSDDWESTSEDSGQGDDGNTAAPEVKRSTNVPFSKRSQEEIENDVYVLHPFLTFVSQKHANHSRKQKS
ncbi:hypothetical protein GGP41_007596 [Bipolaris sorokiniana]|uniref:Uncharacterized protein n=1 Tax=Cochliobolus sativus TaxID=45130 RepID=A0A8H6DQE4_COCSA|nr:hypothetical protein GGP41_007596 [Bipolaris sorokiniana]